MTLIQMTDTRRPRKSLSLNLAVISALITAAIGAIILVVLTFTFFQTSRDQMLARNYALAEVVASNLTAAIAFQDPRAATEILSRFTTAENIISAEVLLMSGETFAEFRGSQGSATDQSRRFYEPIFAPVTIDTERIGNLRIIVDTGTLYRDLLWIISLAVPLWLIGILLAFWLAWVLNTRYTSPLSRLAEMMSTVTGSEDYRHRFHYEESNELGVLASSFNKMMENVSDRDQRLQTLIHQLQQARDEAQAATLSKSSFLANMSHEIRTPLNGIIGTIQLLEQKGISEDQKRYFETIVVSAEALLTIIDDILDFTKIEAGRIEFSVSEFGLRKVLGSIKDLFDYTANVKGIALNVEVAPSVPDTMVGDPGRLRQILLNLVGNGLKFTAKGSVTLAASVTGTPDGDQLQIRVTDTGLGIRPEVQEKIFTEFYQGDVSLTRTYGGTGLGLAITQQLVHLMHGVIMVQSIPGEGSVFTVSLPLITTASGSAQEAIGYDATDEEPPETKSKDSMQQTPVSRSSESGTSASAEDAGSISISTLNILVAEDSEVNQFIIRELLMNMEMQVEVVSNGQEAVEAFKRQTFDLVLMDIQMPVMDGVEAALLIRELQRDCAMNPRCVIAGLSAHAMKGDRERFLANGMDDYLTKPISSESIRQLLIKVAATANGGPK